ncbi:MAG: FAD:protein FMN transferase, partial [Actinobacteria bacterium]|nr:FAD:protein FMN transferase [Actinomycetota bacterium]
MFHNEEVWGTVVSFHIPEQTAAAAVVTKFLEQAIDFVHEIDRQFSTYKESSEVSKIRRGELSVNDASQRVQEIWRCCERARDLTDGAFDPFQERLGGFDPSGYVKGWAADQIALMAADYEITRLHINAGGDLTLRGGMNDEQPWMIGIQHPKKAGSIAAVIPMRDGALASSGTYERGAHIFDAQTNAIAIGALATSVYGPDGGLADALATALMVAGR